MVQIGHFGPPLKRIATHQNDGYDKTMLRPCLAAPEIPVIGAMCFRYVILNTVLVNKSA